MYEPVGQGLSDPVDHVATLEDHVQDLLAVMDAAGLERATVIGILNTALWAVLAAAAHPQRIEALVLLAPFAQGWRAADLEGWTASERDGYDAIWEDLLEHWGSGRSLRMFSPAQATPRNLRRWGVLERATISRAMVRETAEGFASADVRDALPSVRCPVLALRPADCPLPEAAVRLVAERVQQGSYGELPASPRLDEVWSAFGRETEAFIRGTEPAAASSRSLQTVLFTDIVDSTARAAELGDTAWREVLRAHEDLVEDAVGAAGGRVVKLLGDGAMCTFGGPAAAIRAAERIVSGSEVPVRAGLHTGECEQIGHDLAGMTVHIAARVCASASAGEVLVSRTVRDLVTGSGIALASLGEHELKGVPERWELFAVGAQTAPRAAPDQRRRLRPVDRMALAGARRAPRLMRLADRLTRD